MRIDAYEYASPLYLVDAYEYAFMRTSTHLLHLLAVYLSRLHLLADAYKYAFMRTSTHLLHLLAVCLRVDVTLHVVFPCGIVL